MSGVTSISKNAQDRLGGVIRLGKISVDDEAILDVLRENWAKSAFDIANVLRLELRDENPDVTWRQKNLGTIREKLQRETTMRFSQVRDVAGCRIVLSPGLIHQRETVARIENRLGTLVKRSIDHIDKSQLGYRAIHLEIEYEGVLVEIQFRTPLQHAWAEAMERLGDIAGRDVRYQHDFQFEHLPTPARILARSLAGTLCQLSNEIASYERVEERHQSHIDNLKVHSDRIGIRHWCRHAMISFSLRAPKRRLLKLARSLKPQFEKLKGALQ
ncbi:MAG: hypothetical protein D4R92_02215 [Actinobacteria bacterium]|nr:MAG: hypothetical protein D4R92_02215 [Actinomycetota bacterium]